MTTRRYLSDDVGESRARRLAQRLARHKGQGGGRVYINEAKHFFAPTWDGDELVYTYLGELEDDAWFPEPVVT